MLCHTLLRLAPAAVLALSVFAQTITTIDAAGETIIEVITLDPQLGLPTTSLVSTVTGAAALPGVVTSLSSSSPSLSTPTSTSLQLATTTEPDVQQGPVGAPAATSATLGPTIYTYTTTDGTGATIAVIDTFTPTYPSTSSFTPVSTGTVLGYSQWLSIIGSTAPKSSAGAQGGVAQADSTSAAPKRLVLGWASAAAAGVLGGAWLVL